jgi:hypothetical protein
MSDNDVIIKLQIMSIVMSGVGFLFLFVAIFLTSQ